MAETQQQLEPEQEMRIAALREANYYFGFTAGLKRSPDMANGEPTVRAGAVLGMADVFFGWLLDGTMPEVPSA